MKKLISVLVVVMVCAFAFTVAASASDAIYEPDTEMLYSFDLDLSTVEAAAVADDTMYGMVVIEAQEGAAFALTQDNIRYIDQVNAKSNTLKFADFAPMDLTGQDTKYIVYIGGGNLNAATRIGTLALEPLEYYDIVFMNGEVEVKKITKVVGETLRVAEFPDVPAKSGYTGKWSVTTDITGENTDTITVNAIYEEIAPTAVTLDKENATVYVDGNLTLVATVEPADALYELEWSTSNNAVATVEDGVVTAVAEGEATITVTIVGTTIKDECVITVEEFAGVPGDMNGDETLDDQDAIHLLYHVLIDQAMGMNNYPLANGMSGDVNSSGEVDDNDAIYLLYHVLIDQAMGMNNYPLYPQN